jgi:hypothetical protein
MADVTAAAGAEGQRVASSERLDRGLRQASGWLLSERQWGTAREDYTADGDDGLDAEEAR